MKAKERSKNYRPSDHKKNRLRVEKRQDEADTRNNERANRSAKQQLALLDKRLGKGKGAKKERARLQKEISKG